MKIHVILINFDYILDKVLRESKLFVIHIKIFRLVVQYIVHINFNSSTKSRDFLYVTY